MRLLENEQYSVYGIDNMNNYYDVNLKKKILKILKKYKKFKYFKIDINNQNNIKIRSFSGDLTFSIRKTNTPNKKIYLLELMPNNSKEDSIKSYWRKK